MDHDKRREAIRGLFESFRAADREACEQLLAPDFTFTSPYDDHIDRDRYFERCWPLAGTFVGHDLHLILLDGDDAVVHYDGRKTDGGTFRNVERFRFDDQDRITEVEVFFGLAPGGDAKEPRAEILAVLERRKNALEMKDARLVAALSAPGEVLFGLAPPLVEPSTTGGAIRRWFETWDGMLEWETREPDVHVSGDVAYVTALERMAGTKKDGKDVDLWFRTTLGLKKIDGTWKIAHEHQSVPFYMDGSAKAALNLQPGVTRMGDGQRTGAALS